MVCTCRTDRFRLEPCKSGHLGTYNRFHQETLTININSSCDRCCSFCLLDIFDTCPASRRSWANIDVKDMECTCRPGLLEPEPCNSFQLDTCTRLCPSINSYGTSTRNGRCCSFCLSDILRNFMVAPPSYSGTRAAHIEYSCQINQQESLGACIYGLFDTYNRLGRRETLETYIGNRFSRCSTPCLRHILYSFADTLKYSRDENTDRKVCKCQLDQLRHSEALP